MRKFVAVLTGLVALGSAVFGAPTPAEAMTVQPVIIDLTPGGRQSTALVQVENSGTDPLPVELRVSRAVLDSNGVTVGEEAPDDLLIFPPQAIIPPGQTQSFRIQYIGDPDMERSQHYFVTVAQLPVQLPEGTSAIQIVYNFNVIVSVAAPGKTASITVGGGEIVPAVAATEDTPGRGPTIAFTATNTGDNYDYLINGRLRFVQRNAAGQEIFRQTLTGEQIQQQIGFGLIGAGVTRRIATTLELPSADGTLSVEFTPERRR
jgi:fimbrial chaperone protein